MKKNAVYALEMGNRTEIFSESQTGMLDYEGSGDLSTGESISRDLLAGGYPRVELVFPADTYANPLYRLDEAARRVRTYRWAGPEAAPLSPEVGGFLMRYPAFAIALRAGSYAAAGRLVQRSRKLAPYRSLLRYQAGESAFFIFALYWLGEFDADKESALADLLSGKAAQGSAYRAAFDLARGAVDSRTVADFEEECRDKIGAFLNEERNLLVLPIIGTRYRPCIGELSALVASAQQEAARRVILDGIPANEQLERLRAFMGSISVLLQPEPYNEHDPNAVAVLLRFPEGHSSGATEHAGYLKRETAASLAPILAKGVSLRGKIHALYHGDADVTVGAA